MYKALTTLIFLFLVVSGLTGCKGKNGDQASKNSQANVTTGEENAGSTKKDGARFAVKDAPALNNLPQNAFGSVSAVTVRSDGAYAAVTGTRQDQIHGFLNIYELPTMKVVYREELPAYMDMMEFSPDGTRLLGHLVNQTAADSLYIWETRWWRKLKTGFGTTDPIVAMNAGTLEDQKTPALYFLTSSGDLNLWTYMSTTVATQVAQLNLPDTNLLETSCALMSFKPPQGDGMTVIASFSGATSAVSVTFNSNNLNSVPSAGIVSGTNEGSASEQQGAAADKVQIKAINLEVAQDKVPSYALSTRVLPVSNDAFSTETPYVIGFATANRAGLYNPVDLKELKMFDMADLLTETRNRESKTPAVTGVADSAKLIGAQEVTAPSEIAVDESGTGVIVTARGKFFVYERNGKDFDRIEGFDAFNSINRQFRQFQFTDRSAQYAIGTIAYYLKGAEQGTDLALINLTTGKVTYVVYD